MATVFKKKGRPSWIIAWFDHTGRRRERSSRTTDKRAAERIAAKWEADARLRAEGVIDATTDAYAAADRRPLRDHVEDYLAACVRAGMAALHLANKRRNLERFIAHARASRLSALTPDALDRYLGALAAEGKSARTQNHHRQDAVAFVEWCRKNGRVVENRLGIVPKRDEQRDRRRVRRALTDAELVRLLASAEARGRRLWYAVAALAGLRKGDLAALRWGEIDLDAGTLTVHNGKAKRADVLPVHPELLDELRRARPENAHPKTRVFPSVVDDRTRRRDFERAGIVLTDEDGRVADLHALRTTLGTRLARAGVAPQLAQRIMRHGDYRTTLKHYTVLGLQDTAQAVAKLPGIAPKTHTDTADEATGTDGGASDPTRTGDNHRQHQRQQPACDSLRDASPSCDDAGGSDAGRGAPDSVLCDKSRDDAASRDEARGSPVTLEVASSSLVTLATYEHATPRAESLLPGGCGVSGAGVDRSRSIVVQW